MKARKGDTLCVESRKVGGTKRTGTIVKIEGKDGEPPYRVRWSDSEDASLVFPGSDAKVLPPGSDAA